MIEPIRSSEMPVLTRATRRHIPEDGILHSHRLENLKSYTNLHVYVLWMNCSVANLLANSGQDCLQREATVVVSPRPPGNKKYPHILLRY
jgi:hypothetical protein